jgi:Uma2 family endonuclease
MLVQEKPSEQDAAGLRRRVAALKPGESFCPDIPLTLEEYFELVDEDSSLELIHGTVFMPTPPSDPHEALFGWLFVVLAQFVELRQLGVVRGSRTGVRTGTRSFRVPDILFLGTAHLDRLQRHELTGAPDFIIEIVDSDASRREAVVKQAQYEEAGAGELWIIDLPRRELRHFVLEQGRYQRVTVDPDGEAATRTIPGFRLQVAWLFAGPSFPNSLEVVHNLLRER